MLRCLRLTSKGPHVLVEENKRGGEDGAFIIFDALTTCFHHTAWGAGWDAINQS